MNIFSKISQKVTSKEGTNFIRFFLDECLPPILRDQRWFYGPIIRAWNRHVDIDFKQHAVSMTEKQIQQAYERTYGTSVQVRQTDMTRKTADFVLSHVIGHTVLEVGCGNGDISIRCAQKRHTVFATDLVAGNLRQTCRKCSGQPLALTLNVANIEHLPFPDRAFDVTICLHTLEHVKNLSAAIEELKRVTKRRIIIVVPQQRNFRYTCDYHVQFFWHPSQLALAMGIPQYHCETIDYSLCYIGDLHDAQ